MKRQTLKDRIDEHLGAAHKGKKKMPMAKRRKESEGMEHAMHHSAGHALKSHAKKKK